MGTSNPSARGKHIIHQCISLGFMNQTNGYKDKGKHT